MGRARSMAATVRTHVTYASALHQNACMQMHIWQNPIRADGTSSSNYRPRVASWHGRPHDTEDLTPNPNGEACKREVCGGHHTHSRQTASASGRLHTSPHHPCLFGRGPISRRLPASGINPLDGAPPPHIFSTLVRTSRAILQNRRPFCCHSAASTSILLPFCRIDVHSAEWHACRCAERANLLACPPTPAAVALASIDWRQCNQSRECCGASTCASMAAVQAFASMGVSAVDAGKSAVQADL